MSDTLAAIDLGSNSFHMIIARFVDGQMQVIDRLKEMVRLGGGFDDENNLTPQAQERALEALEKFGDRLRGMPRGSVRAVGTNTLRKARNSRDFLKQAQHKLGHPIEIISGREEGRLVYLGVAHDVFDTGRSRRLVVDIGGGSTELIIGQEFDLLACESLHMGCVSFSQAFFPDGELTAKAFERATLAARKEMRSLETTFPRLGWEAAFGSSGTIKAIAQILGELKLETAHQITLSSMHTLRDKILKQGTLDQLKFPGLSAERAPVLPGGLAILIGVFESLRIQTMERSDFALREGVIYDLHGRHHNRDVREHTIASMATKYAVDREHARQVEDTAWLLFGQVASTWGLGPSDLRRLRWACRLHEIGLAISHSRYHKHGSYLVENSDMEGFSKQDQQLLWALVRSQRRRFKPHRFHTLPSDMPERGMKLCVILRLAILLNRSRNTQALPTSILMQVEDKAVTLRFPQGWLEQTLLIQEDLRQEQDLMGEAGFNLTFDEI